MKFDDEIELEFLGTATSTGVPMIGCGCEVCNSDNLKNKRYRPSVIIRSGGVKFVIDTGPEFRLQCLRSNIYDIDSVLYTHAHMDHIAGFDDLRMFTVGIENSIDVYGNSYTLNFLKKVFFYAFAKDNLVETYVRANPKIIDGDFKIGHVEITPLDVIHGNIPTNGFIFSISGEKKIAYIPDCKVIPDDSIELLKGVNILVIDALHHKLHPNHMNFTEATEISKKINPKKTYFTHLTHFVDHDRDEKNLDRGILLSYDGLKIRA